MHARFDRGLDVQAANINLANIDLSNCSSADQEIGNFFIDEIRLYEETSRNLENMQNMTVMIKNWMQVAALIPAPANYTFQPTDGSVCRAHFVQIAVATSAANSAVTDLYNLYDDILQSLRSKNVDLMGNDDFMCWAMTWNRTSLVNATIDDHTPKPFEPKLDKMFSHPDRLNDIDALVFALTAVYDERAENNLENPIVLPDPNFLSLDTCSRATTFNGMELSR